jgi:predicted  nucleic acid-binding Zn-ribbon protein
MDDLKALLELQEIDEEIRELEGICSAIPVEIEDQRIKLEKFSKACDESENALRELRIREDKIELDIEEQREQIVRFEHQQSETKSNAIYSALNKKIEDATKRIDQLMEQGLELIDKIDSQKNEVDLQRKECERHEREFKTHEAELLEQKGDTENSLKDLREKRVLSANQVPGDLLKRYQRIKDNKAGLAVVPMKDNACSGCFGTIPIQKVNEIKHNDELKSCDNCGRIIYYR